MKVLGELSFSQCGCDDAGGSHVFIICLVADTVLCIFLHLDVLFLKGEKLSPQRSAAHLMSHHQELAKLEFKPKYYSKGIALPTMNTAFLDCAKVPLGYFTLCITHG